MDRKTFLIRCAQSVAGWGLMGFSSAWAFPFSGPFQPDELNLSILYTNDLHSSVQADATGLGGLARRARLIKRVRQQNPHTILLDAGDVYHGTPWFARYGGAFQFRLMSKMGYDAMVLGNHEFDEGMDALAKAIRSEANFPVLAANYDVSDTPLDGLIQPFTVLEVDRARLGIFGLGIELKGLVDPQYYSGLRVRNPITVARGMVRSLRTYKDCDMVIALSHLGYDYADPNQNSDRLIAQQVKGIDLIIGGHTHTELAEPVSIKHSSGWETTITQAGSGGTRLGKMDVTLVKSDKGTDIRV
ncbi:MAG: bifunctional metallophosphatase/5'-nucleotidase [Bacteroidota bacterium]